ncbi:MAG: PhzF family phenazine biosynthesis protein [Firmicutes bacterium]|nr:PhzF family phenazine biosynthesis protein [Bacillota bacterium]MBR6585139.1 PhzF family phenazine biosynthesis protein [Bacillota bacterium]
MKFYIVDAFTQEKFGGNPAGVVILPEGADFPSDELMVKTAAELRYSETAFIKKLENGEFNIRYFTPAAEVDLCGHATIASFKALLYAGIIEDNATYINHTLSGDLEIVVNNGFVLMDMAKPVRIGSIVNDQALEELYTIMGLDYADQKARGLEMNPQMISTGLPDIMMPVVNLADLEAIAPNFPALSDLSKRYEVVGVHAFTLDGDDATCHVRNFAPLYDIDEEAATGTSNGALTYYGYLNGFVKDGDDCKFIQGEKMQRPSQILSNIKDEKIKVGGDAVILAEGEIHIA